MQRLTLASLVVAVASQSNDALSLLQTSVGKHNQSLLQQVHLASRNAEEGKKECRAAKQTFRELKTTMKADRQALKDAKAALKDAKAALKAAKLKRTETKKALKEARGGMEEACVTDDSSKAAKEGKIMYCKAHETVEDFPRWKIDVSEGLQDGTYSIGRAGEPCGPAYNGRNRDFLSGAPDCDLAYDIQAKWGVPTEAREPDEKCKRGCGISRGSANLGNDVPSADVCLKAALGSPACQGMASITWINVHGDSSKGQCFCTAGTTLTICSYAEPLEKCTPDGESYLNPTNPSYKRAYSLTCLLPKKPAPTAFSTFKPAGGTTDWRPNIPVCNGGEGITGMIQDQSEKSILVGTFGSDIKGRAACADQSWKDKQCVKMATRLSFSKRGECRCEWGPLLISDAMWRWKLNGAGTKFTSNNAAYQEQLQWSTCLYPRDFLKQGKDDEAFASKHWR